MTAKEKLRKDNIEYIKKAQNGDKEALDILVKNNLDLVYSLSKKFLNRGVEDEEIYQIGSIGLIKSIQNFNIDSGNKFSTYAVPMILGEIQRFLRDGNNNLIKVSREIKILGKKLWFDKLKLADKLNKEPTNEELSKYTGYTLEEVTESLNAINPYVSLDSAIPSNDGDKNIKLEDKINSGFDLEETVMQNIKYQNLYNCINKLPEKQRDVILLRLKEEPQTKISKILKVSQAQVSRLERKAHLNLKKLLEEKGMSKKEDAFKLFRKGKDNHYIENELGITLRTVETYRSIYNRSNGTLRKISGKKTEAFELFEQGLEPKEVVKKIGLAHTSALAYKTEFNTINKFSSSTKEKEPTDINLEKKDADTVSIKEESKTAPDTVKELEVEKTNLLTPTAFKGNSFKYEVNENYVHITDKKQSSQAITILKKDFDLFLKELLELKGVV